MSSLLIAVDVGNSRISLGLFDKIASQSLPQPSDTLDLPIDAWSEALDAWLQEHGPGDCRWALASVNRPVVDELLEWLQTRSVMNVSEPLTFRELPLEVALEEPERVGIDRLLAAVAVNRLRNPERAAIVVDVGSAITVDLVTAEGEFAGGAILPGIRMSARALHEQTDQLPLEAIESFSDVTPALGTSTRDAIQSGLFWGAMGAIRELIARLSENLSSEPDVFLTGGASPSVSVLLGDAVRYEPHLVLCGIALCGRKN